MRIKMPAVRFAQGADASEAAVTPSQPDILTCGVCQKPFALGDIMKFIQHKVAACNKENYLTPFSDGDAARHHDGSDSDDANRDRDGDNGLPVPLGVVNARRPSISAPINSKKCLVPTSTSSAVRILCTPPSSLLDADDPRCSTPIKRRGRSTSPILRPSSLPAMSNHLGLLADDEDIKPLTRVNIGRESGSAESSPDEARRSKLARIDVADAESNTINSEPNNYVCSTCKQRLHSAWRLVQHVQNAHGMKIYVESTSAPSPNDSSASKTHKDSNNRSSSSNCSSSSACSSGSLPGPTTPLSLPPPSTRLHPHPPPSSPLLDPLHHPFPVGGLLRHPFPPTSMSSPLGLGPLFPRPSSHDHFRMEQLVSEQFRLSQQSLGLAAASANATSIAPPPPVSPFGPTSTSVAPTSTPSRPSTGAPPAPLNLEPQLDFYSQRLRQLAGATSPGAASAANGSSPSPSPRQGLLTPPFSSSSTPGAVPAAVTPLSLNNSKDSNNSNNSSSISSTAANNNNNSSAVNNNNSNNNNTSLLNNNTSGDSDSETRPPRPQSLTPPEKQSQLAETPSNPAMAITSTPRSASTPPDADKPTDFSRTAKSMTAVDEDGERIHDCEFCGKKFRFQSSLIAHRRVHTGEKPYKCSVCDHACAQHSKLKRHMKTHRIGRDGTNGSDPDQLSNAGSVETLDDDDEEDDDDDEEDEVEEEEEEEEDMELEEEDADDDDDLGGDAPEDLTTKSNSSTPPNNNNTNAGSDKNVGSPRPTPASTPMDKVPGSLVGELMDKFGLNHIAQYSEAYKQALQESVIGSHPLGLKDDLLHRSPLIVGDNNNIGKLPRTNLENGILEKSAAALRFREEFAKNMLAAGQPPLDLVGGPHGIFGPGTPFDNPFDTASKRLKLDLDHGSPLGRPGDRADLYAGLWLPTSGHPLFPGADTSMDLLGPRGKSSDLLKGSNGPKAGPSASSLAAAAAAALNLGLPVGASSMKKDSRRNDTCEFCGKVFKNCSNLTVHRRSHTGEKPYKCELCPYACAQSSKLTRHMKTHGRLGKDVYRCRFCEMPFSVPSTLEKHMRKCVVNQNAKGGHHFLSLSGDEDSSLSAAKDSSQWEQSSQIDVKL